jgi:hypothetical protein
LGALFLAAADFFTALLAYFNILLTPNSPNAEIVQHTDYSGAFWKSEMSC